MPKFIPGLELCGAFYAEAVRPILDRRFPGLAHSAARLGEGSEVLGFDTPRSTDHGWGPKLDLFLFEADHARCALEIERVLGEELPFTFRGYPTNFNFSLPYGWLEASDTRPVHHGVKVVTVARFFSEYLGIDPRVDPSPVDWLTTPEQRLATVARGRVYHDGLGELAPIRERLRYYPRDLWLYLLAAQWQRIGQEEAFVGRTGDAGDELGSRVIAARLVRDLMRLSFLMERSYAPYSKWFGTAFARLDCAAELTPSLEGALGASTWREREAHLSRAYEAMARRHNRLGLTPPLPEAVSPFYDRPYLVIHAEAFAEALWKQVASPEVKRLAFLIGSVDQFVDSTDVLSSNPRCRRLRQLYEE